MAYVRRLPSGNWNAVVRHPSGRKISKTDALKRVVVAWAADKEREFRAGAPLPRRGLTFADWCDRWLLARSVRKSTARKDESRLRLHIRPHWDGWPLQSIGRLDVQVWVNGLHEDGLGAPTVAGAYQLFATCMAGAVDERLILSTPCQRIKLPTAPKPVPRWFTRDEYERIQLALGNRTIAAGGRRWVPDEHRQVWQALVALACWTGLRPQELAGLDVRDIDLERGFVYVRQTLTRHGIAPYGKSDRANRFVPFPPEVGDLLWPVIADRPDTASAFFMPRGGRLEFEGNFRARVWLDALEHAGIEPVRFYTCRHTFASWAVQAGVPDRELMNYLGHADTHLINVYAHLDPHRHESIRAMWSQNSRPTGGERTAVDNPGDLQTRWSRARD